MAKWYIPNKDKVNDDSNLIYICPFFFVLLSHVLESWFFDPNKKPSSTEFCLFQNVWYVKEGPVVATGFLSKDLPPEETLLRNPKDIIWRNSAKCSQSFYKVPCKFSVAINLYDQRKRCNLINKKANLKIYVLVAPIDFRNVYKQQLKRFYIFSCFFHLLVLLKNLSRAKAQRFKQMFQK